MVSTSTQQRLDDLDDVVVNVIALQLSDARTPHLELLGYRTPCGHKASDTNVRAIAADRLMLRMQNLHATKTRLGDAKVEFAASCAADSIDDPQAIPLRDPDGHWLVLM